MFIKTPKYRFTLFSCTQYSTFGQLSYTSYTATGQGKNATVYTLRSCSVAKLLSISILVHLYREKRSDVLMEELLPFLCLVLSAMLWGVTDAFMKLFAPPPSSSSPSVLVTLVSLLRSPAYLGLLLLNQLGSVLYYYSLSLGRLSVISPFVNTGKFIFTAVAGRFLGEPKPSSRKVVGLLLLLSGVILQLAA